MPKIAIIIGSTRDNRFGEKPARWIYEAAAARGDIEVELVDLRDYDLPFFNEVASNLWVPSQNPEAVRWQKKVGEFDGYVFVTAEYNRSIPAVLKNALDQAYREWNRKPAACVGYGTVGAARAIEHLRLIAVELQMAPTRTGVHLQGADFYAVHRGEKELGALEHLKPNVQQMLDELVWWTHALKDAREASETGVRPA
jgi:NAD(P)H-dependent FMN reductase